MEEKLKRVALACFINILVERVPGNIIIMTLADKDRNQYLRLLKKLMVLLKDEKIRKKIIDSAGAGDVLKILSENGK